MAGASDPKNYYGILGVAPDADLETIKVAFRTRAKLLHPDHNDRPGAEADFRLLNEAYRVLGDPERRQRYYAAAPRRKPKASPPPPPEPPPRPRTEPEPPREPPPRARFHACRACGTVTAQPRIVSFREIGGRPFAATQRTVAGVFCPRCAADAAIRASLHTWVRGLVAVPRGPLWAIPALCRNLTGGEMPVEANARMLLSQARAFLGKGDVDLARASIAQALPFAAKTAFRHEAETLLASIGGGDAKILKSRWPRFGRAFWVQAIPFAAVAAIIMLAMLISLNRVPAPPPPPPPPASKALVALPSGPATPLPVFVTARDRIALFGGPSRVSPVLAWVAKGTTVTMTAIVPGEDWVQIRLPDGRLGFVVIDELR